MSATIVYDQRQTQQKAAAAAAQARSGPSNQGARTARRPKQRTGVKNIEERGWNRTFRIERLLAQPKNIDAKKNGAVVCKMVVRRKLIFLGEVRRVYY